MDSFCKIDAIDRSILKVRSILRINEPGFSLTVWKVLGDLSELEIACFKVMEILIDQKTIWLLTSEHNIESAA